MNAMLHLIRSSWQFYRRHPAQLILSVTGIVLGVAIVTAVLITNHSSQKAFGLSADALYGKTTHQISGARGIQQDVYVQLKRAFPSIAMAPIIQDYVVLDNSVYSLVGLDPFAEMSFNRYTPTDSNQQNPLPQENLSSKTTVNFQLIPRAVLMGRGTSETNTYSPGDDIELSVGGNKHSAVFAGYVTTSVPAASNGLLFADIAFVQNILKRHERIDRIDLLVPEDDIEGIRQFLPDDLTLDKALSQQQTMKAMTRGFHINLTAMSLLALVVGAFLIHNTMTFAVVQRREVFATKRIIGVTRKQLMMSILTEAAIISSVGSALGIALGYILAHGLIRLTTQTINDLYFVLHVQEIWFNPWLIVAGLALGIGSSLLAASISAFDAAGTSPIQSRRRSSIENNTQNAIPLFALAGLLLMILGWVLAKLPSQSLLLGFLSLMFIILGYGSALPWLVRTLSVFLNPVIAHLGVSASLAVGGIERNISRTGLAIAALCIAVSATLGVDIMIGSFRTSVDQWLGATLHSDIYVSSPSAVVSQNNQYLDDALITTARGLRQVKSVSAGYSFTAPTNKDKFDVLVIDPHSDSDPGFELLTVKTPDTWPTWVNESVIMISEPMSTKARLELGDSLDILTEAGIQTFSIAGVFRDYESSHGKILMSRKTYSQYWSSNDIITLGLILKDADEEKEVIATLNAYADTNKKPLRIQSNHSIHKESLIIFDRTFEVTRVLRWLTVGVAFVGIFSALLALHLERAREFAVLRATGATRKTIMQVVLIQTLLMGIMAGILALPLGWIMSELLVHVINVRSFGWSMASVLPEGSLISSLQLACVSALLAGLYPAYRLSRANIAEQLRDD